MGNIDAAETRVVRIGVEMPDSIAASTQTESWHILNSV